MARRVFYSFHFQPDNWRASQVRNVGVVEGNQPVSDNDWEAVKRGGDDSIKAWINGQLAGRACTVVLIGSDTAGRKWIKYEIERSWNRRDMGLVGIYVHNLKDASGQQSTKGGNPFNDLYVGSTPLGSIVKAYDPPYSVSTSAYDYIKSNLAAWIEEAITIRSAH